MTENHPGRPPTTPAPDRLADPVARLVGQIADDLAAVGEQGCFDVVHADVDDQVRAVVDGVGNGIALALELHRSGASATDLWLRRAPVETVGVAHVAGSRVDVLLRDGTYARLGPRRPIAEDALIVSFLGSYLERPDGPASRAEITHPTPDPRTVAASAWFDCVVDVIEDADESSTLTGVLCAAAPSQLLRAAGTLECVLAAAFDGSGWGDLRRAARTACGPNMTVRHPLGGTDPVPAVAAFSWMSDALFAWWSSQRWTAGDDIAEELDRKVAAGQLLPEGAAQIKARFDEIRGT